MQDRRPTSKALLWLRTALDDEGRVSVPIGSGSRPRIDRYVMMLLIAGLLQPLAVSRRESQPDTIVYGLTDDGESRLDSQARDGWARMDLV